MDVNAVHSSVAASVTQATPVSAGRSAETRDVVQAIKALNGADPFGAENELVFQKDPHSGHMVIRLVSRKTGEVVSQLPPEYVLRLAEDLRPRNP
jgi:uncharacterized FlaG/YvyC family protein